MDDVLLLNKVDEGSMAKWILSSAAIVPPEYVAEFTSGRGRGGAQEGRKELADQVDKWLRLQGLPFDPFRELDAGADAHLGEYLYGPQGFEQLVDVGPSLVFAPAGGGKTALRVWLTEVCRTGSEPQRFFPIVYRLPFAVMQAAENQRQDAYIRTISQAAAWELLLYLAYRPTSLLILAPSEQARVRALLSRDFPMALPHFLNQIEQSQDLARLASAYDRTARWTNPPGVRELARLKKVLLADSPVRDDKPSVNLDLFDVLTNLLGFEAIYLLLDGVDAYPDTISRPDWTVNLLSPLWTLARSWSDKQMFLKAFLPIEFSRETALKDLTPRPSAVIIEWTAEKLSDMLSLRLEAASRIPGDSLDRLSEPNVRGVEARLVQAVVARSPLPRELLLLVEHLFAEHVNRTGPVGRISVQDVEDSLTWYTHVRPASQS